MRAKAIIMKKRRALAWLLAGALFVSVLPASGAAVFAAGQAEITSESSAKSPIMGISIQNPVIFGANCLGSITFEDPVKNASILVKDVESGEEYYQRQEIYAETPEYGTYRVISNQLPAISTYSIVSVQYTDEEGQDHVIKKEEDVKLSKLGDITPVLPENYLEDFKKQGTTTVRINKIVTGTLSIPSEMTVKVDTIQADSKLGPIDIKVDGTLVINKFVINDKLALEKSPQGKILVDNLTITDVDTATAEKYLSMISGSSDGKVYCNITTNDQKAIKYIWSESLGKWTEEIIPSPTAAPTPAVVAQQPETTTPVQTPATTESAATETKPTEGKAAGNNQAQASVAKVNNAKVKVSGKNAKVSWKKLSSITGYEVQYAKDKKFTKGLKTVTVKKASASSTTIKKLKKGTYYVRIRAYKKKGKLNTVGAFSKTVKFTVK